MRRVVFVGNCQAQALTDAFNRFVAPFTGERAFHVPAFRDNDEAHRAALERADVIVELVFDFSRRSDPADLGLTAPVIAAPYVNCQFLWPYAYEAHPRSARSEFSDSGPYPIQLSDAFLNRLMREGVPEEEAAARYLDLDINQKVRLDRRLEMTLALQRQRDEKTGFAVADLMERYFREEPIFLTPYHPNRRIFLHVVERCFARLGVAEHLIARLPRLIRRSLFLQDALPVHPRLAAHFGLVWANEATRYPFWLDGDFTFAEFIGRYLRFDWCEDFARGHYHARQGQNAEAIARLRAGLGAYPEADRAWVLLSHVYTAEGALPEALAAAREAVSRNPRDGEYFAHLGNLLTNAGEVASARAAYERAVALEPEHTPWLRLLAGHWERQGKRAEAGALVATLADKDPLDYELHVQRGHLLAGRGDNAGAVMAFSHALGLAPHIEGVRAARSHTLAALERWEEAIADARAALAETPENRDLRRHLDNLLRFDTKANTGAVSALSHLPHALVSANDASAYHSAELIESDANTGISAHSSQLRTFDITASGEAADAQSSLMIPVGNNERHRMRRLEDPADATAVNYAYLLLFGRNPESDDVIEFGASIPRTIGQLRVDAMESKEYCWHQRLAALAFRASVAVPELGILNYDLNASSDRIIFLQTSDPERYFDMLVTGSRYNRLYCDRWGLSYQAFIGIKRGYYPHHATLNRIFLLYELVKQGHKGWVLYVDADAITIAPDYNIPLKFSKLRACKKWMWLYSVKHPNDQNFIWYEINAGIFAIDLASNRARLLLEFWYTFYTELMQEEDYRGAKNWNDIMNDQSSLCALLTIFNKYLNLQEEIEINWEIRSVFEQILRSSPENISHDEELSDRCVRLTALAEKIWCDHL